jgi:hypothetical protein
MPNIVNKSYRGGKYKETKNERRSKKTHFMSMPQRTLTEWPRLEEWLERYRKLRTLRSERT